MEQKQNNQIIIPKRTIQMPVKIKSFLTNQNYLICQQQTSLSIYDTITKDIVNIQIDESFILQQFPPFIFCLFVNQYLHLYNEEALKNKQEVIKVKISKLQVCCICRFNKGYYMGGYNRSVLPGGQHTNRRQLYYMQQIIYDKNNKPKFIIKLPPSQKPVSILRVQNPYLLAFCIPNIYILSVISNQIIMKFQKQAKSISVLENRYAISCFNGIGISCAGTIWNFDMQNQPIYGIQINQHQQKVKDICQSRTGKIYCCFENVLFEYNPLKQKKLILITYPQTEHIISIICTQKNSLLVARNKIGQTLIDIFAIQ